MHDDIWLVKMTLGGHAGLWRESQGIEVSCGCVTKNVKLEADNPGKIPPLNHRENGRGKKKNIAAGYNSNIHKLK